MRNLDEDKVKAAHAKSQAEHMDKKRKLDEKKVKADQAKMTAQSRQAENEQHRLKRLLILSNCSTCLKS